MKILLNNFNIQLVKIMMKNFKFYIEFLNKSNLTNVSYFLMIK